MKDFFLGIMTLLDSAPAMRPRCPIHGEVLQTLRLKNLEPELNGEYCGRCLAEAIARMCQKVDRGL